MIQVTIYTRTDETAAYATVQATHDNAPIFRMFTLSPTMWSIEGVKAYVEELREQIGQNIAMIYTAADPDD